METASKHNAVTASDRFVIMRDCCTSGNCITCTKVTPFGVPLQIEHSTTNDRAYAQEVTQNWKSYKAVLVDRQKGENVTAFQQIENTILDNGGRLLGTAGRMRKDTGVSVAYYVTEKGSPIILQVFREGGVEVFTPLTGDRGIKSTLFALQQYMHK